MDMQLIQSVVFVLTLMILFVLINLMMNYISRRDGEPRVAFRKKLWLIPLLSAFIMIPLVLFAMLSAHWFPAHPVSGSGEPAANDNQNAVFSLSLLLLIGFLIFESFIHPLVIALLRLLLRKDASLYIKQTVTVLTDTVLIYSMSLFLTRIPISGWLQSLLIVFFFHLTEWILIGVQAWIHRRKRANARNHQLEPAGLKNRVQQPCNHKESNNEAHFNHRKSP
ncbi:hypothetical protein [Paenibacillus solani]|uniref:hypothetical protein n=1 Tax=Paenibacillus solani TaxID=1705565 RepID=UPI001F5E51C0|nr:hypothetical protein [Paenibacillus solani]